ncbi:class I SAM-dependent methyltransferase [Thalassospira australica]|uniref:class I SAM-dependent methyltransferase n=1 Tax=Thalassospira australica TaxID=1528106 RepID=UPI00051A5854|nr:class I SAM-dependent methyltransferase [Thalassospira australica]
MKEAAYRNHQHYINEGWSSEPKETFKSLARIIKRYSEHQDLNLLDVGCATGELLGFLSTEFECYRLVGADITQGLLDTGARLLPKAEFVLASALDLPESFAEQFDVVTSIGCMSIFNESEIESFWENLFAAVKPGGLVIVLSPLNEFGVDAMIRHRKRQEGEPGSWETGWNIFSQETISEIVANHSVDVKFERFRIPFAIERRDDPIRTWTMQTENKDLQLTNGLKLLIDHCFVVARKSVV